MTNNYASGYARAGELYSDIPCDGCGQQIYREAYPWTLQHRICGRTVPRVEVRPLRFHTAECALRHRDPKIQRRAREEIASLRRLKGRSRAGVVNV